MYKAIVIGTSYGGLEALKTVLPQLNMSVPIIIVLHIGEHTNENFLNYLNTICRMPVREAESNEPIRNGVIYFAPPNYHLLIETDFTFSLTTDEKCNYSRPSIDRLFESAAWAYGSSLIGLVMTGANSDGAAGLKIIKDFGGVTIVEDPDSALSAAMPLAALRSTQPQYILGINDIASMLNKLAGTFG